MRRSKKQPLVVLSADENKRLSSFCQLLMTIDRRVKARSKQKRSQAKSRISAKKAAQHTREVRPSDGPFYCSKMFNLLTNQRNVTWYRVRTNTRHVYDLVLCWQLPYSYPLPTTA